MLLLRITTTASQQNLLLRGQHKYFIENGFEVIAMCSYDFHVEELISRENCKWINIPFVRNFRPFRDLLSLVVLIFHIIRLKPDIVHTHSPKAGLIGQLASYICRVPCRIHTVAGLPLVEYLGIKRSVLMGVEKLTNGLANWVLPNSLLMAEFLVENKLARKNKVRVIGNGSTNGINVDFYSPTSDIVETSDSLRFDLKIPTGFKVLLYVGRLARSKGIIELINAFLCLRQTNSDVYLVLTGNFDEKDLLPLDILDMIQNTEEIVSVGHQKDVRPFLQMADIFIFPSYREGLPQALLQSCCMSKCCVATNISGCNEIIENDVNGLLIPPKNVEAIVDAVNKLIHDEDLRKNFGFLARKNVLHKYNQSFLYDELKKFYHEKSMWI